MKRHAHKNVDKKSPVFRPKLQLKNFKTPVLSQVWRCDADTGVMTIALRTVVPES
jgi:hypothetical protein